MFVVYRILYNYIKRKNMIGRDSTVTEATEQDKNSVNMRRRLIINFGCMAAGTVAVGSAAYIVHRMHSDSDSEEILKDRKTTTVAAGAVGSLLGFVLARL